MLREALDNLALLGSNPYPGRGIVIGMDDSGENLVQAYWIMGRSENSRNRVFVTGMSGRVSTMAADPAKVKDPSLIIYDAMLASPSGVYAVSNGSQTGSALDGALECHDLLTSLRCYEYEPDAPNFTPRITAVCTPGGSEVAQIAILRRARHSDECDRAVYVYDSLPAGYGYCITTYSGDGNPLPPFRGEPYLLPLRGPAGVIEETIWGALNPENRIALAVKLISRDGGSSRVLIRNRFLAVST